MAMLGLQGVYPWDLESKTATHLVTCHALAVAAAASNSKRLFLEQ